MSQRHHIAFFANPAGMHNMKWIKALAERHDIILVCGENIQRSSWLADGSDFPIYPILPALYPHRSAGKRKRIAQQLQSLFAKHNITIAHSMYAYPHAYYPSDMGWDKHVITTRGSDVLVDYKQTFFNPQGFRQRLAYRNLRKAFEAAIDLASFITSTSSRQIDVLKTITDSGKLHLIRSGLPVPRYLEAAKKFTPISDGITRLFHPRAMAPLYNQLDVVEAFRMLTHQLPDNQLELTLIDDRPGTPYSKQVHERVAEYGMIKSIHFLPLLGFENLVKQYVQSDLVLMMPQSDGTPNTALEAMVLKRPLVMGALGYDTDLFGPDIVWRTEADAPEVLAVALRNALEASEEEKAARLETAYTAATTGAALSHSLQTLEGLYNQL